MASQLKGEGPEVRDTRAHAAFREEIYDAYYYAHDCGRPYQRDAEWLAFFGGVADCIVSDLQPRTVLDAGCAMGFLVEKLRERDVSAFGIDVSAYAIQQVHESVRPYCQTASITEPLPQKYDLIVNIEVLEHLTTFEARAAIPNLCRHTDRILFSSTPVDYREVTHLNVQPPEYWAELFAREGFIRDVDYDASYITPWAALFRRAGSASIPDLVRGYERRGWLLQHESVELRAALSDLRETLKEVEQEKRALLAEVERLESVVAGFSQGRVMRMLAKIQGWWGRWRR
jgi:SAM-dependent methyltransferase